MNGKGKKIVNLWLPPLIWSGLIFIFSALPTAPTFHIYWQDFILKKTAHIIEYAILTTLFYRAFRGSGLKNRASAIYAVFISVFYGLTDEFHQIFTPGREPRIRDVFFDTIGATLAIFIVWKFLPKAPKKLKSLLENWGLI